jgi:hypothetical protein
VPDFGIIHFEQKKAAFMQRVEYSYRFEGNIFIMGRDMLLYELPSYPKVGERFVIGGVPFVNVEYHWATDNITAVRDTNPIRTAYYRTIYRITPFFRLILTRIIATLAVWNLAQIEYGEIPSLKRALLRRWRKR